MSVKIRINRGKLYLDIYTHGHRKWESLGLTVTPDKQQMKDIMKTAEICRSKRENQIISGEWGLLDPLSGKQTLPDYMASINKTNDYNFSRALKFVSDYKNGNIALGNITEKWLEDFQDYLIEDCKIKKSTASLHAGAVRRTLKKATRDRVIPRNPAAGVKAIKIPETDRIYLENSEVQKLANIKMGTDLGEEARRAFLFACFTGLRISDIKSLQWGDITREPLQIAKKQEKSERKVFVPLHETAWKIINDSKIHNYKELVFPLLANTTFNTIWHIKQLAKRAGIEKNVGWHTARRTFATLTLEAGADIATVAKLLDHRDLKTTQIYAKATDQMKRKAVNALPGIEI